jgi:hypothetical protein
MRYLFALLLLLAAACSSGRPAPSPSPVATKPLTYTGLGLEGLGSYQATFDLSFEGTFRWGYHLETRANGRVVEYRLHLEGLEASRNPGDVRLVAQEGITRMHGPGTEDACVQFPSDLDLGPIFLTPDNLIDPDQLREPLAAVKLETVADLEAIQYTLRQASLDKWRDLTIALWRNEATGATLRYNLRAVGPDPLFGAGEGVLSGGFLVREVGPQLIEPIPGCDIDLPLPGGAARLIRLPELIAFDSAATAAETAAFYQAELAGTGWEPVAEPQMSDEAIVLSYQQDTRRLDINIETSVEGVHVELLLGGG